MKARSLRRWGVLLASAGAFFLPGRLIRAEAPPAPIRAELVKRIEADQVHLGEPVLARVESGWRGLSCELRPGDILEGRIVFQKHYSKADKTSEIAILFNQAQCGGPAMKPLPLTVAAVLSAGLQSNPAPSNQYQPLSDAVGLTLNGGARSVNQAAATVYYEPRRNNRPDKLRTGQVVGISRLKLFVGKGPEGGSILSFSGRELRLDRGTEFVLLLRASEGAGARRTDATGASASNQPAKFQPAAPDPPDIADETEVCAPPACHVGFDEDSSSLAETPHGDLIFPTSAFGYLPPSAERDMLGFDYDTGVAFLGPGQLLFTFDPRVLVKRTSAERISSPGLRIVRAMVLDLATKQVVKSVDWRVADPGQYWWPLRDQQVLVHVGEELRIYGPGLAERKQIPLGGPLAFVRESPSSAFLAVGVVNERHTPELHRQLQEAEGREPEEDIEVRVLNSALRPITKTIQSSRQAFPVLSDDGEVRVLRIGQDRWRIAKYSWAGQRRVLAQASSSCLPSVRSLPADLLFVVGCDRRTDTNWYRVLREDRVMLKGSSSSAEFEYTASGVEGGNLFAIGIARAKQSLPWGKVFRTSDLQSQHIALYGVRTGQRILALNVSPVVPALQTFAISPREDELAVVTTGQITLYRIPSRVVEH